MRKSTIKVLGMALVSGAMVLPAAHTVADEGQYYISIGGQRLDFDNERQAKNDSSFTLGLGYDISDSLSTEINYSRLDLNTRFDSTDVDHLRLDFFQSTPESFFDGAVRPYLLYGIGHNRGDSDEETFASLGVGINVGYNDSIDWRFGVRAIHGFDDSTGDYAVESALIFRFGGSQRPSTVAPTPAPTPAPAQAQAAPAPDSDGDGVPDSRDDCPDTPRNHRVDARGCSIMLEEVERLELRVQFDFDSDVVKPEYLPEIRRVADFLRANGGTVADLEGHTDSTGPDEYNQQLSERRVNAVREVLVSQFGIESGRVTARGYGESQPVASNDTADGRAQNRRVVSVITATLQVPQTR